MESGGLEGVEIRFLKFASPFTKSRFLKKFSLCIDLNARRRGENSCTSKIRINLKKT